MLKSYSKKELGEMYVKNFNDMYKICEIAGWGDPFSYARSREILMANYLGHEVAETLSGADAYTQTGTPVEYKSTIGRKISATYNGVSVHSTWEEQEKYLREEKIGKYPEHYFARFEGSKIVEVWVASGEKVLGALLPKFKKQFLTQGNRKDPRLGAALSMREIHNISKRIRGLQ